MIQLMKALIASLLLLMVGLPAQAQEVDRPDVLFISIDDLNDWVGVLAGHAQALTPNIDALADRGLLFTNAHTASPLCNPSRTSLMLGLRPSTTGIYGNFPSWMAVEPLADLPNLPRYFRENGYRTSGAGKLFHAHTFSPAGFLGYNDPSAWDAYYPSVTRQLPDEIAPHTRPANRNPVSPYFDWSAIAADDRATADGQVTAWIQKQLVDVGSGPRFVAAGIYRPHLPWYVPQKYLDMYPLETILLPEVPANDLDDVPLAGQNFEADVNMAPMVLHEWIVDAGKWREGVQAYLASVSFADAMVGQLLEALDRSGRARNTIIVLWSDHGFHLGEKLRWRKQTLWEEATRVPLIIVAPGVTAPGTRSDRTVSLLDIFPTLLELTGLPALDHLEGESLVPLLKDPDAPWDRPVVTTYEFGNHAVRSERFRYIKYADGSEELYDHERDPGEWTNLAADPDYAAVKADLARWLPERDAEDAILLE